MKNCSTCENGIFDTIFGEYKCKVHKHIMYDAVTLGTVECIDYKKGTPVDSIDFPEV